MNDQTNCRLTNVRYQEQQKLLTELARLLGVVAYRPDYHGKAGDKNTVLFYTREDHRHNLMVDRQLFQYSRSEAKDLEAAWKHPIDDKYVYRDYFWCFENSDQNGYLSYDWANHGTVDLRYPFCELKEVLKTAIVMAFSQRGASSVQMKKAK